MTDQELLDGLQYLLGVQHWRVKIAADRRPDVFAEIEVDENERSATFYYGENWDESRRAELMLHELVHVLLADLTWTYENLASESIDSSKQRKIADTAFDHEIERVCDTLARAISMTHPTLSKDSVKIPLWLRAPHQT